MDVGDKTTRLPGGHVVPAGSFSAGDRATAITYNRTTRAYSGAASLGDRVKVITYGGRRFVLSPSSSPNTPMWITTDGVKVWTTRYYTLLSPEGSNYLDCWDSDDLRRKHTKLLEGGNYGDGEYRICTYGDYIYLHKMTTSINTHLFKLAKNYTEVEHVDLSSPSHHPIQYLGPGNMCTDGTNLYLSTYYYYALGIAYICDLTKIDCATLSVLDKEGMAKNYGLRMATDGANLWVFNYLYNGYIRRHSCSDLEYLDNDTSLLGATINDGVYLGGYLYITTSNNQIIKAVAQPFSVVSTIAGEGSPWGITGYGDYIYVTDLTGKIMKYTTDLVHVKTKVTT